MTPVARVTVVVVFCFFLDGFGEGEGRGIVQGKKRLWSNVTANQNKIVDYNKNVTRPVTALAGQHCSSGLML